MGGLEAMHAVLAARKISDGHLQALDAEGLDLLAEECGFDDATKRMLRMGVLNEAQPTGDEQSDYVPPSEESAGEIERLRSRLEALQSEMFKLIDEARFEETAPVAREIVTIEARLTELDMIPTAPDHGDGQSEAADIPQAGDASHRALAQAGWRRMSSKDFAQGRSKVSLGLRDVPSF